MTARPSGREPAPETPPAPVAVCCLTSRDLVPRLSRSPFVAAAGTLMTANLGIEEIVAALRDRPEIHTLLVCGKDSPRFHAGQSLVALFRHGLDPGRQAIRGAEGYHPVLRGIAPRDVEEVRQRVTLVDERGECDPEVLDALVGSLADGPVPGPPIETRERPAAPVTPPPARVLPGGRRKSLLNTIEGFVVITLDHENHRIHLRHYDSAYAPRHEMFGHRAESMLLGVLNAGIVADPSHAGYLGGELTKAETALRLGLPYEQDIPLRRNRDSD